MESRDSARVKYDLVAIEIMQNIIEKIKTGDIEKYVICGVRKGGASIVVSSPDTYGLRNKVNQALKDD